MFSISLRFQLRPSMFVNTLLSVIFPIINTQFLVAVRVVVVIR